ncbi:PEP-utilizing enzyme [Pseudomonas tritici]|uniref:PEP-utilizing enzyme n=1 Tax=Pseudomonas tritici TaxID=2745518 RepID=UPI00387B7E23
MKASILIAAAVALIAPSAAFAFPIAVGVAGVGVLGVMAFPVLLFAAGAYWVVRNKGRGLVPSLVLALAATAFIFLSRDYGQEQAAKASLFTKADTAYLSPSIPFPFISIQQQVESAQAVTPAEFVEGMKYGHFKALKISTYPSLFATNGQVAVDDLWRDKAVLVDAVNRLGGRVVLVDDFGGIAASIAGAALHNFGLNVGFLQGGTIALSKFGWGRVDQGLIGNEGLVPVEDYRNWIAAHPKAFVIGLTTDREFVEDGWQFGDKTMTLADFLANYQELVMSFMGREVFIAGFETNDSGATHIAVTMLRDAGVRVHYVMPSPDEILIKPAYFDTYHNDSRTVTVEDAERYILLRPDVEFLDFSEHPWPIGVDFLKGRYHHLPMQEVAKGALSSFVAGLDPSKVYIGLAFDRRTAYHSLLAGQLLTERGAAWLGRFTLASSLTEPFLTVDDLNSDEEQAVYAVRDVGAFVGQRLLGSGVIVAFGFGLLVSLLLLVPRRKHPIRSALAVGGAVMLYACVLQANADFPRIASGYTAFMGAGGVVAAVAMILAARRRAPRIRAFSNYTSILPPKAALLNLAAARGYRVAPGVVVAALDLPAISAECFGRGQYIVRSAMMREASDHGVTAGLFDSFKCASRNDVSTKSAKVFESFASAQEEGFVLVQRYVEAEWYGVIQVQRNERSPWLVCDVGIPNAVTIGDAPVTSCQIPLWDVTGAPSYMRKAALALIDLMEVGAYSLEFAVTRAGRLTILQVNHSKSRACAGLRLREFAKSKVIDVSSVHAEPLSAAIVAALSPGQIFAYGHRRFCLVQSPLKTKLTLRNDIQALGFNAHNLEPVHLVAWVDSYTRCADLHDKCLSDVPSVVSAITEAGNTLGRMNRVATAMLALGGAGVWELEARTAPSSLVGEQVAAGIVPVWAGAEVGAMTGFSATSEFEHYTADELAGEAMAAVSPLSWVKDATSTLLAARLAAIKPSIAELIAVGKGQDLYEQLGVSVGDWDAQFECTTSLLRAQLEQPFASFLLGEARTATCWRIPAKGVLGAIETPSSVVGGGILLLDRCGMEYLPLLKGARAVVAMEGAITSHLMQHAESLKLPVVIGGDIARGLAAGDVVYINPRGGVDRA